MIITVFTFLGSQTGCMRNHKKPDGLKGQLIEMCKLIPPDFRRIESPRSTIGIRSGTYGLIFCSRMSGSEVRDFYLNALEREGWKMREESSYNIFDFSETRYLTFEKEPFRIALEFRNLSETREEKEFFLNCTWDATW